MNLEKIKEMRDNRTKFGIPRHTSFYVYPPAHPPECNGEGRIESIDNITTAQALIIVCNSCGERWGSSLDAFPDISAMERNHAILDPHHIAPLLPQLQAEQDQDKEELRNFINNCSARWEHPIGQ